MMCTSHLQPHLGLLSELANCQSGHDSMLALLAILDKADNSYHFRHLLG